MLGSFSDFVDSVGMVDPQRLRDELRRIRSLIAENADVRARFDKDGNGVIDGVEWEEVRQLVVRKLEREAAAAAAADPAEADSDAPPPPSVADEVYEDELASPATSAGAQAPVELVLRQEGSVLRQAVSGVFNRSYSVLRRDGTIMAEINQIENEMLRGLGQKQVFDVPPLSFAVRDHQHRRELGLRRELVGSELRMAVEQGGREQAYATRRLSLGRARLSVAATSQAHPWQVRRALWRPFDYDVSDAFDEKKGKLQLGWSGLGGFLTGGNLIRLHVRDAEPDLVWGLIGAMLLIDIEREEQSRRDD